MRIAFGLAVVLALVSAVLTLTARTSVGDASEAALTLRAADFAWQPDEAQVPGGSQVLLHNEDPYLHTFTIDALGIDQTLSPGSEALVTIPDEPGVYIFYCGPHTMNPEDPSEDDMAGRITVT